MLPSRRPAYETSIAYQRSGSLRFNDFSFGGVQHCAFSDFKLQNGNPPCSANNNATFNNGQNTGCKVEFHWLKCDGTSHGSAYSSCTNTGCRESCSCSCLTNPSGYGTSWVNTCVEPPAVRSESETCKGCPTTQEECEAAGWYWDSTNNTCNESPQESGGGDCVSRSCVSFQPFGIR